MDEFDRVAAVYDRSQSEPVGSNKDQARLYGLYRQAIDGDIDEDQPGFFDFSGRARYDAWKELRGMPAGDAKQRFVELAKKLGYSDPGDSPVPWISDETWRREESWAIPDYDEKFPAVAEARPIVARSFDRDLAPKIATANGDDLPPEGDLDDHRAQLDAPPRARVFRIYEPFWPVCCRRLSSLVGHLGMDEVFESVVEQTHHLRAEIESDWDIDADAHPHRVDDLARQTYGDDLLHPGKALYHCGDCGSVYVASCAE